jgi:hypothetical protein
MERNRLIATAVAVLAIAGAAGCGQENTEAEERGDRAVELCQGHGGVSALDDDIVICRDESVQVGET